jgi:hypothetical protein
VTTAWSHPNMSVSARAHRPLALPSGVFERRRGQRVCCVQLLGSVDPRRRREPPCAGHAWVDNRLVFQHPFSAWGHRAHLQQAPLTLHPAEGETDHPARMRQIGDGSWYRDRPDFIVEPQPPRLHAGNGQLVFQVVLVRQRVDVDSWSAVCNSKRAAARRAARGRLRADARASCRPPRASAGLT